MINHINIKNKYIYLISDIHSNINLFKKIISDINLKQNDHLFILGDVIEKDDHNIETLDYLMELDTITNLHLILGNCDNVINEFKRGADLNRLYKYSHILKHTILNEFYSGIGIDYNKEFDVYSALDTINIKYKKYFDFINSFNKGFIVNDKVLLLHADLCESLKKKLLTKDEIDNIKLKELNVCGHLPTALLDDGNNIIDLSPKLKDNFLYIDGGNNVVPFGVLNLFKLDLDSLKYQVTSYDSYELYEVIETQREKMGTYIALKQEFDSYEIIDDIVKFKLDGRIYYGDKSKLILENNKIYGYDTLNIFNKIEASSLVKVACYSKEVSIVIQNNKVSLIKTKNIKKYKHI